MFNKFISWLAQDQIKKARQAAVAQLLVRQTVQKMADKQELQDFEIKQSMGKKIIYCSNEWQDPEFGIVVDFDYFTTSRVPMLKCKNVLYGNSEFDVEEYFFVMLGTYLIADELMTGVVLRLSPFQRWNLVTGTCGTLCNLWQKSYPAKKEINNKYVLASALRAVNFMLPLEISNKLKEITSVSSPRSVYDFFVSEEDKIIRYRRKDDQVTTRVHSMIFQNQEQMREVLNILGIDKKEEK